MADRLVLALALLVSTSALAAETAPRTSVIEADVVDTPSVESDGFDRCAS